MNYPKVLIISHNLFDTSNNIGKTLVSLFNGWPKDKICQIFLKNDNPSFKYCNEYFQILDKDIAKHFLKRNHCVGNEMIPSSNGAESEIENSMYQIGNKRIPMVSLIRDILWNFKYWKNDRLDNWLNKVKPEIILFVPNDYELIYPIAFYVKEKLNLPLIPYYMDDAFYINQKRFGIDTLRRNRILKLGLKINKDSKFLFTIGPKMSSEYAPVFKKECIELMNSVSFNNEEKYKNSNTNIYTYAGNLHSGRWKSLIEIGESIDKLNDKTIQLNVYTQTQLSKKILSKLNKIKCINLKGSLKAEEVRDVLLKSDLLIFMESFNKKDALSTRLSLSTKIPEYLSTKTNILAYGPSDISAIEYLKNNDLALVATNKKELEERIHYYYNNKKDAAMLTEKAYSFARKYHNIKINSDLFKNSIVKTYEDFKNE